MEFPSWYQSSQGPQVSQTIFNIVASFIPMINLALASKGINLLPEQVNFWITLAVFLYFSVRAALGYIKAKKVLATRVRSLSAQLEQLKSQNAGQGSVLAGPGYAKRE